MYNNIQSNGSVEYSGSNWYKRWLTVNVCYLLHITILTTANNKIWLTTQHDSNNNAWIYLYLWRIRDILYTNRENIHWMKNGTSFVDTKHTILIQFILPTERMRKEINSGNYFIFVELLFRLYFVCFMLYTIQEYGMGGHGVQHAQDTKYENEIIIYVWIYMCVLIFSLFIVWCFEKEDVAVIFEKAEENNFQWNLHSNNLVCSRE